MLSESTLMTGGRVTTLTSRSKRAVFRSNPSRQLRRLISPCRLELRSRVRAGHKLHVSSVHRDVGAFSRPILNAVLLDKGFEPANAMWSRTWTAMAVAWPRAVTGDGRSTTGGACRVNRIAIDDKATIPITTIKTFRISHCSALKEDTGAMAATICRS